MKGTEVKLMELDVGWTLVIQFANGTTKSIAEKSLGSACETLRREINLYNDDCAED